MWRSNQTLLTHKVFSNRFPGSLHLHKNAVMTQRHYHQSKSSKRKKTGSKIATEGSNEEVVFFDVRNLLTRIKESQQERTEALDNKDQRNLSSEYSPPERFSDIELEISELSSIGDGLAVSTSSDHVYVVPFTVPGDVVQAKVVNHFPRENYTLTDFVKLISPGPQRDDSLIRCPYFARCAGCQIQMLPYEAQLAHKKTIIEKAFRNFSALTQEVVPKVGDTIGSPLQYGYRTKLTPHFDGPPGCMSRKVRRDPSLRQGFTEVPPIGFNEKGTRKTIDIEDCPIGTDAVREGIKIERRKIAEDLALYKRGATILLRETTTRKPRSSSVQDNHKLEQIRSSDEKAVKDPGLPKQADAAEVAKDGIPKGNNDFGSDVPSYVEDKSYITDQRAIATEYIDNCQFKNTAGAFFQNNNSILPKFTAYIRDRIIPISHETGKQPIKYLIDAYCGSGLFTITLSSLFSSSMGIDIAGASIESARENAVANDVSNASFMTADAAKLFEQVTYPPEKTAVIIDPPRKGCDDTFLQQLQKFGPQRVVYVSCNVHTQARDVGVLVEGLGKCRYEIESLQGFDFFPQTSHVEGVAILNRST